MSASGATHAFSQRPLWCAYRPFIAPILQASISEGLGHRLVHLMDRKFVGDEPVQRTGGLGCVQEAQVARVAGRGMVGHSIEADLVGQQMPVRAVSRSFTKM